MKESGYTFLRHLGAALVAGLLFSLVVGLLVGFKMIGINEATHRFHYGYPFMLNFIPMYLLLGLFFGIGSGILGGLLLRDSSTRKALGIGAALGISLLAFLLIFIILRAPLGPIAGMFLTLIILVAASGLRPRLSRLYFSIFFTAIFYNYSWQWVRQHFIINPLMPLPSAQSLDFAFTVVWAILFLLGYRLFLRAFFRLPVKAFYSVGTAIIVALLVLGGIYYVVKPSPVTAQVAKKIEVARRPADTKIVLIGIDGLWWKLIDALLPQGKLPSFQKLIESGSSGPLATLYPTFSAAIWSSISTGKSPKKHEVTSFLVWRFPWSGYTLPCFITPKITAEMDWMQQNLVTVAPISNQFLDATPFWDMISDHGGSVGILNWWLSYPAYPINGFNVTDHCLYNEDFETENFKRREGNTPYDIYPQEFLKELLPFSRMPDDLSESEIRRFINVMDSQFIQKFYKINSYSYLDTAYEASIFKYGYTEDATLVQATRHLIANHQTDLLAVYLDGMDAMQHQYLKYYFWEQHRDKLIPQNIERYKDLVVNYYVFMDEAVGSFMEVAAPNTIFLVISDHGFDEIMMPTGHYNHLNSPPGVFICSGPGIKQNYRVEDAHVYDITPTLLHLLGFPVAEDFDGKVLTEIMLDAPPVEKIATYESGRRASHQVMQTTLDEAYKERLKALGYTQ